MKKFLLAICTAMLCTVAALCAACKPEVERKKPEKLKDGTALTLTEGASESINLAEYISLPEGYVYEVSSSAEAVATAKLEGNTAKITAVSKGNATITASADEISVTFAVTVNEKSHLPEEKPAPVFDDITVEYDLKDEDGKTVTLAPKSGAAAFVYTYALSEDDSNVTISDDKLKVEYTEAVQKQLIIVATYTDTENASAGAKTVEFTLYVNVTDTRDPSDPTEIYKVKNGGFDNGLTGWTMEGVIGEISEEGTFWENLPILNDGKYFAGSKFESAKGTLASSWFVVGGVNKISFKLGAAGNSECYITLEKADGTVLAIWRNTKFKDIGTGWKEEEIGKTQFACNLVTYVADLTGHSGEKVRVVLHDNATEKFGFFNFDSLVTYYAEESEVPAGVAAVSELADKSALKAVLESALNSQGDYTAESYNAYAAKIAKAQEVYGKLSATQAQVDAAKSDVETAFNALEVRVPEEKAGADKEFGLLVGNVKQLTVSDYVDGKNLSSLTYSVEAADGKVTVSAITDGKFTVTAGADEAETAVTITVSYKGEKMLTVTLKVTVTSETAPVLKHTEVRLGTDLYSAENKTDITIDFANNVDNVGELDLTYTVTLDGSPLTLTDTSYTYAFAENYTETPTEVVFAVKISYNANGVNGELGYNYILSITDTSAYRIVNGGFETGDLNGWALSNRKLGAVSGETHYWLNDSESKEGFAFGLDGSYMFSAYADGEESAMGTLTSSPFKIGGSGWISFKLGAAKNADKVYLDIIEKDTGTILARYSNKLWQERTDNVKSGCKLIAYKVDLSGHAGKTVYICVSDYGESDYGLFFLDSVVTYYADADEVPQAYNSAEGVEHPENIRTGGAVSKYQVYNGGFENGLEGWTCVDGAIPGAVSSANRYWGADYGNTGKLFTAVEGHEADTPRDPNLEYRMGTIRSEKFTLKANAWISFRLGGSNYDTLGIRIVKTDGTVIARFQNTDVSAAGEGQLVQYKYHFDNAEEIECYIEIFDNEPNGEGERPWRLVVVDEIITDLEAEPADGKVAANQIA